MHTQMMKHLCSEEREDAPDDVARETHARQGRCRVDLVRIFDVHKCHLDDGVEGPSIEDGGDDRHDPVDGAGLRGPPEPEEGDGEDDGTDDAQLDACLGDVLDRAVGGDDLAEIVPLLPDMGYGTQEGADADAEIRKAGLDGVEAVAVGEDDGEGAVEEEGDAEEIPIVGGGEEDDGFGEEEMEGAGEGGGEHLGRGLRAHVGRDV